jgi:hypothetical protein
VCNATLTRIGLGLGLGNYVLPPFHPKRWMERVPGVSAPGEDRKDSCGDPVRQSAPASSVLPQASAGAVGDSAMEEAKCAVACEGARAAGADGSVVGAAEGKVAVEAEREQGLCVDPDSGAAATASSAPSDTPPVCVAATCEGGDAATGVLSLAGTALPDINDAAIHNCTAATVPAKLSEVAISVATPSDGAKVEEGIVEGVSPLPSVDRTKPGDDAAEGQVEVEPPLAVGERMVRAKVVADVVEALIGAWLLAGGMESNRGWNSMK